VSLHFKTRDLSSVSLSVDEVTYMVACSFFLMMDIRRNLKRRELPRFSVVCILCTVMVLCLSI